jgi:hypothetical protein
MGRILHPLPHAFKCVGASGNYRQSIFVTRAADAYDVLSDEDTGLCAGVALERD